MRETRIEIHTLDEGRHKVIAETFPSVDDGRVKTMFRASLVPGVNGLETCFYSTEIASYGCPEYAGAVEEARALAPEILLVVNKYNAIHQ